MPAITPMKLLCAPTPFFLMTRQERLAGCIVGGAIGDAWGSAYENYISPHNNKNTFYLGQVKETEPLWSLTDDTQLTLITLEALFQTDKLTPETLAGRFVQYYKRGKITGIGASTLKALQELEAGGHWSQVGRSGEYAAGNGAAMRIAPFAFWDTYTREDIRDFCRITHRNDEAYTGALAVAISIQQTFNQHWTGENDLIQLLIPHLPDTNVRDRLIELSNLRSSDAIIQAAKLGTNGYVVNSVPFAIFCASQVKKVGMVTMYHQIVECGGDTDTNASIAGQIAGALVGEEALPATLKDKLKAVRDYEWLNDLVNKTKRS